MCYNGKSWGIVFVNFEMKLFFKDLYEYEKIKFFYSFKWKFDGD